MKKKDYSWLAKLENPIDLIRVLEYIRVSWDKEKKVFSQNKEDGVIEYIFDFVGTTDKYYVEFGVEKGIECNTRLLREKHGWKGLMMDGSNSNPKINLQKEHLSPNNIVALFEKYKVPNKFDFLSVDTDMYDYFIIKEILTKYTPRVIILEINSALTDCSTVDIKYIDTIKFWLMGTSSSGYTGASLCAMYQLLSANNYSLVYSEKRGVNAFFIHNSILKCELYKIVGWRWFYHPPAYGNTAGHIEDGKYQFLKIEEKFFNL